MSEYMTRREIAAEFKKHPMTVQYWHDEKKIVPDHKKGRTLYYRREDVEALIAELESKRKTMQTSEIYEVYDGTDGRKYEHGFALTYPGWLAYSKRKSLDDVPVREIIKEYIRSKEE